MLLKELMVQGAQKTFLARGGVHFQADDLTALRCLVQTRLAGRVYMLVTEFEFKDLEGLYQGVKRQWWDAIIGNHQTFKITTLFDGEAKFVFRNSMAVSLKAKDAIADQCREKRGARPDVDTDDPDYSLLLRVEANTNKKTARNAPFTAQMYLDLCGVPLSNRGLRSTGHEAPLRENAAAAMVLMSDWRPQEDLFIDPFCGTGTILVEAAWLKAQVPPTLLRLEWHLQGHAGRIGAAFAFTRQRWYTEKSDLPKAFDALAKTLVSEARKRLADLPAGQFFGSDVDVKAISLARKLMDAAGLGDVVQLRKSDARKVLPPGPAPGVVLCNPPYGERLGTPEELLQVYHDFGENLKANFKGYRAYILTGEAELRKKIRLQTSQRLPLRNGNIDCRVLRYELR